MISKALLTLAILLYGIAPLFVDLNSSHLFHPDWTPHSRLHMAWLLGTNGAIGCVAAYFVWVRGQLLLPAVLSCCVLGGFFAAAFTLPIYHGDLSAVGEKSPKLFGLDGNLVGFGFALACVIAALVLDKFSSKTDNPTSVGH